MSKAAYEGNVKIYYLPACADPDAPTVAEIAAGTNWSPYITKDGVEPPANPNMVDSATIEDVFDSQEPGSWGGAPLKLILFRDNADETLAYDMITYGLRGFVLVTRFGDPSVGAVCEVYPIASHEPTLMKSAGNEMQKFQATMAVTSEPSMRAAVAA